MTVGLGGVTRSQPNADVLGSVRHVALLNFGKWADQVALNVVGQGFDWRDVDGVDFVFQFTFQRQPNQLVQNAEEGGEGFT